jgi:4-amino-4-deoxy-L-arabinose transferase-like glycosyltransferase
MSEEHPEKQDHRKPLLAIAAIIFLLLIPFVNKAYHLDDPFYLWTGQHILEEPLDFYGYEINWTGFNSTAAAENKNPPLVSYYMALVGLLVGWQEWTMHLAFMLPAIAIGTGGYLVASRYTERPLLAMVIGIATPAFVVSSTNVMAEIMMLGFYVWAIHFWMLGVEKNSNRYLFLGALCIVGSTFAKYFGFSLFPLLIAYTVFESKRPTWWILHLGSAFGMVLLYEAWTLYQYDIGLLSEAANFATSYREENAVSRNTKSFVGVSFTGGCVAVVAILSPILFSWKWQIPVWSTGLYFFFIAYNYQFIFQEQGLLRRDYDDWNFIIHFSVFCVAGIFVLMLPVLDLVKHRTKESLFLFCWVMGTFLFASQVNWTANARSIVPMVPAIGILVDRRLSLLYPDDQLPVKRLGAGLAVALLLCLTLSYADYTLARAGKLAAAEIAQKTEHTEGAIRFSGHWGYQYYMMEHERFEPVVYVPTLFKRGDVLVISSNNTGLFLANEQKDFAQTLSYPVFPWVSAWSKSHRAGFYSDIWGGIPFAFGAIPDEEYHLLTTSVDNMVDLTIYKPGSKPVPLGSTQ